MLLTGVTLQEKKKVVLWCWDTAKTVWHLWEGASGTQLSQGKGRGKVPSLLPPGQAALSALLLPEGTRPLLCLAGHAQEKPFRRGQREHRGWGAPALSRGPGEGEKKETRSIWC